MAEAKPTRTGRRKPADHQPDRPGFEPPDFGVALAAELIARGRSVREFGRSLGWSKSRTDRVFGGGKKMTAAELYLILTALNLPWEWLTAAVGMPSTCPGPMRRAF